MNLDLRSVQVEIDPKNIAMIDDTMEGTGFKIAFKHYTSSGQKAIDEGATPETVIHNAVFTRA